MKGGGDVRSTDKFAAVDFEMPDLYGRRISAVGICTYEDGKVVDSYYSLIDPQCEFAPAITEITGLTAESVVGAPTFGEAWEEIRPLIEDKIIIAHGAANDLAALSHCMKKYKIERPEKVRFACTFALAQAVLPKGTKFGLESLSERFGIELAHHHNALSDAHACAELFLRLREICPDTEMYEANYFMPMYRAENAKDKRKAAKLEQFTDALRDLGTEEYAAAEYKTMPDIPHEKIIGVKPDTVKKLAEDLSRAEAKSLFFHDLPHKYYEEDLLHAYMINNTKSVSSCLLQLENFLPHVSDIRIIYALRPLSFRKHSGKWMPWLLEALSSDQPNIQIFACDYLRVKHCGKNRQPEQTEKVLNMPVRNNTEVQKAQRRYFTNLFVTYPDAVIDALDSGLLDDITVRSTAKCIASHKYISAEQTKMIRSRYLVTEKAKFDEADELEISV